MFYTKNKKYFFFFLPLLFLFSATNSFAQKKKKNKTTDSTAQEDYYKDFFRYDNWTYKKNIRTVKLSRSGEEIGQPIIRLNSEDKLQLSFDDLDGDVKTYNYTLIHCDASWNVSGIMNSEFLSGFYDELISEYKHSFNTLQSYTHYNLVFPSETMKITKSGNYVVKVFADYNQDSFVLSRRFMVYEDLVETKAVIKKATDVLYSNYKQEIDFTINSYGYNLTNPYSDLKVVILQNGRWDNANTTLKPMFVKDKELDYNYDDVNSFMGGSEFRRFDTKTYRYHSERIKDVVLDSATKLYKILLLPDEKRAWKKYTSDYDMNGNFIVKVQEGNNSNVEADYVWVNFFVEASVPSTDGNFYLFGAFTDWQCLSDFKMKYNSERFGYECTLLLKQGYYNYEYVFLKDGETIADNTVIEGMHFETENDYTILVYHREIGGNYDKLICVKHLNSAKNQN